MDASPSPCSPPPRYENSGKITSGSPHRRSSTHGGSGPAFDSAPAYTKTMKGAIDGSAVALCGMSSSRRASAAVTGRAVAVVDVDSKWRYASSLVEENEDENEQDKLPAYAPTIQLLALCRRKNELDATDRKAKRRSWEVVWLLLDGTALRVYRPTEGERKKFEREWKAKYCSKVAVVAKNKDKGKKVVKVDGGDDEEESEDEDGFARPTVRGRTRSSSTAKAPLVQDVPPSPSTSRTTVLPTQTPTQAQAQPPHPLLPSVLSRKPQTSHTLLNATLLRATTYFKRNFVLRFSLPSESGRQFLVQLNSHEETLRWLEAVQVACPLALDLDERCMPDVPKYPRSRRLERLEGDLVLGLGLGLPEESGGDEAPRPRSAEMPQPMPATSRTSRRPRTAPASVDLQRVPNLPPVYATSSSTSNPPTSRRRRSREYL